MNRLDGTQVMSMRLKKVCPQCDATLHTRKLACPCGHVFPAKAQQTKRKRPIESRQSDNERKAAKRACETGEETVNRQAPSRFSVSQICVYTQVALYNAEGSALQCFHFYMFQGWRGD